MQVGTLQRLKRLYELVDMEPSVPAKRVRLSCDVHYVDRDLVACTDPKSSGFYSANIVLPEPYCAPKPDLGLLKRRPHGVDFRIKSAIKNYKPPKPLPAPPVKTVRFAETVETSTPAIAPAASSLTTTEGSKPGFSFGSSVPQAKSSVAATKSASEGLGGPTTEPTAVPAEKIESKPMFGSSAPAKPFSFGGSSSGPGLADSKPKSDSKEPVADKTSFSFAANSTQSKEGSKVSQGEPKPFSFGSSDAKDPVPAFGQSTSTTKPFSFGANSSGTDFKPAFGQGGDASSGASGTATKPFAFGDTSTGTKPFSFGSSSKPQDTAAQKPSNIMSGDSGALDRENSCPPTKRTMFKGSSPSSAADKPVQFSFGSTSGTSQPSFGSSAAAPAFDANKALDKPSFNFGGSGAPAFGANTPAFGASAPTFGANTPTLGTSTPAFGANTGNPLAGGSGNPLAGGSSANGRKIAPIRRRIPR